MNDYYWSKLALRVAQYLARPIPSEPDSVPSPCMSLCRMHPLTGICEGCLRTLPEIGRWGQASDEEKHQIWVQMPERLARRRALEEPES